MKRIGTTASSVLSTESAHKQSVIVGPAELITVRAPTEGFILEDRDFAVLVLQLARSSENVWLLTTLR